MKVYTLADFIPGIKYIRRIRLKVREWRIKHYKHKKVKEVKNDPVKNYHLYFKLNILNGDDKKSADTVFDIIVPASGHYFARKTLTEYVMSNIEIEVVHSDVEDVKQSETDKQTEEWEKKIKISE